SHPDLHVAGGYDCSSSDRTRWQDRHGHGTHVAGTIGALDDGQGVVGVAPGVRLWAVKILNEEGFGYLSWYVCGLDWIAAQVDPADPSRPLFEAVNMSVAKAGRDDRNCGYSNDDILHQAICRVVARGITVVAAAANDAADAAYRVPAAYNEVITVSALADTDGRPGGLGGRACYSWGTYDVDDTFADFSNYGADVDLIAPGKCIWSTLPGGRYGNLSGTSMATPHVTGAVALYKATRPAARPADVRRALQYLGTLDWRTSTDPDGVPDRLLDVSRLGPLGTFGLAGGTGAGPASTEAGGVVTLPVSVTRSPTFFEDVSLAATDLPAGWTATFDRSVLYGFEGTSATLSVRVAPGTPVGTYRVGVTGSHAGRTSSAAYTVEVTAAPPVVRAPVVTFPGRRTVSTAAVPITVSWPAATDASGIAGYDLEEQIDGGAWRPVGSFDAAVRSVVRSAVPGRTYAYRLRASDVSGTESDWVVGPPTRALIVSERHASVAYRGTWTTYWSSSALGGTARYSSSRGATVSATLSGSEIAYVGPIGPTRGQVDVYVDGVYLKRISLYSATARSRVVLSVHRFAAAGTHRLTLRVVGTPGRPRVDVDGFIVRR
ncbi:MAG TPA: S8 family serine peptidase, partial [Candidatus Limnocylindrales bacterium]|nr:S8 family serine peptidase [Candidatus Limnocylindrales bacterium]